MIRRAWLILALLGAVSLPLVAATGVSAQVDPFETVCDDTSNTSPVCNGETDNPISGSDGVLIKVVEILSYAIGVAAVIMLILGGLKYITSGGDSNAIASAKNTILYAIIGVLVALAAQAIIIFVIRKL